MSDDADRILNLLERAIPGARGLIAGIGPDQWGAPTPCTEMSVLDVVQHLVGGFEQFGAVAAGHPIDFTVVPAFGPDGALAAFDAASTALLAGWSAPGVADRSYAMPWGETPGVALLGFSLIETVTHGWDLARATGQEPAYDDAVVAAALEMARDFDDPSIRVPGMFGPAVAVADDAPLIDRLAGFLGRAP